MSQHTSIERYSFVATFELIADGHSFAPTEIAPDFITLPSSSDVPLGSAELIIRYNDRPEVRRQIQILGPVQGDPLRISIRRPE
ncbi:MAG TPA: hypothetical protein PLY87_29150 [Planctomycetaceae bacterium]|nr:hypothetical protein [Planctomycetaceae bacterium]HQZ69203.1 hypothetical protein [Planctomycetaceae bacterium]